MSKYHSELRLLEFTPKVDIISTLKVEGVFRVFHYSGYEALSAHFLIDTNFLSDADPGLVLLNALYNGQFEIIQSKSRKTFKIEKLDSYCISLTEDISISFWDSVFKIEERNREHPIIIQAFMDKLIQYRGRFLLRNIE